MKTIVQQLGYVLDSINNIWINPSYEGIAYNDGDEIETRIASIIQQVKDLSVLSTELRQHCTDWPSLYHLTGTRANIMRPFEPIFTGANVLEIGAGCGAITRYLGECGAHVLALEGSPRRASITRSRTRDLENITVLTEKFDQFQCNHQFDVITLIGVLEYANLFTPGENPALAMLERVRKLLKPDGHLIIAIENQLGLKYFAGAPEDHLGQPMIGIEGRYRKDQPQTFGRKVLAGLIEKAGFETSNFLAPFPDYKLPVSIVTEAGFANKNFDAAAFAWQSARRDPQLPTYCNFSLELAWPEVFANELGLDVSNSFLVIASPTDQPLVQAGILAYHYSTGRVAEYCKQAVFSSASASASASANDVVVHYRRMGKSNDARSPSNQLIKFVCPDTDKYILGKPLSLELIRIVTGDGWTFDQIAKFVWRYLAIVEVEAKSAGMQINMASFTAVLPGNCFDIVPQNIIIQEDGKPSLIDKEWLLGSPIELGHLLFRTMLLLLDSVTRFGRHAMQAPMTRHQFIDGALAAAGFNVNELDIVRYMKIEAEIQQSVTGRIASLGIDWGKNQLLPFLNSSQALGEREGQVSQLSQALGEREGQVSQLSQALGEREGQVSQLSQALGEREGQVSQLSQALGEREGQVSQLSQALGERDGQNTLLQQRIAALQSSSSWRITVPFRFISRQVKRIPQVIKLSLPAIKLGGGVFSAAKKAIKLYRREGIPGIKRGFRLAAMTTTLPLPPAADTAVNPVVGRNDYAEWVRRYDTLTDADRANMRATQADFASKPLISVLMPTYNSKAEWLTEAIESVRSQIYPHWELCIADDASPDAAVRPILERYASQDPRIKIVIRSLNGHISEASNSALALATGQWVALLDHDDILPEHALFWVAHSINAHPDVRLIYSDEDKTDESGRRFGPYFKSDWNPDLFYSHNMFSHLGVYEAALFRQVGGFRKGFEGAQDYDLALRCIEQVKPTQIFHIPRVLYQWRVHAESTALSADSKPYAMLAGERAIQEHFDRTNVAAEVSFIGYGYQVKYKLPAVLPLVSIIIPTRNGLALLKQCIDSIFAKTTYSNYEIVVVDNGSDDPATLAYFKSLSQTPNIHILRIDAPFNYSALNNAAVKVAKGELICLLNNDIEVISPEWLSEMVSHALRPGVGAVGAKLWYPNDTLQHGGVILGVGGVAAHAHQFTGKDHLGYFGRAVVIQNYSAVTAACLVVRKSIYHQVGGLNETDLAVAFNDVDFCIRVREAGYRNIWTPVAELYHHESATRGYEDTPEKQARFVKEVNYMVQTWGKQLDNDPAYSLNLTLEMGGDFSYAWPPRAAILQLHPSLAAYVPPPTPVDRVAKTMHALKKDGLGL